jgi:hypothetical protein
MQVAGSGRVQGRFFYSVCQYPNHDFQARHCRAFFLDISLPLVRLPCEGESFLQRPWLKMGDFFFGTDGVLGRYAHLAPDQLANAAGRLDGLLPGYDLATVGA